jgi:hypothetical protein
MAGETRASKDGRPQGRSCPVCGGDAVPIVFGLPGPRLFEAARRGVVALGGCIVDRAGNDPNLECCSCGHRWRSAKAPVLPDLSGITVDDGYF